MKVADIQNSYITVPVTEKIWKFLGLDFGEDDGSKSVVVISLYGLKSVGSVFWNKLADCMHHLGFLTCPSDLDIWMKPVLRPADGYNYYAYVPIYVGNAMDIHNYAESVISRI